MLVLILLAVFVLVILSSIWFGLWNNLISLGNFLIAAIAAWGLRDQVNDLFSGADPAVAKFGDFLAVWGVFVLSTVMLRVATDTLSTIRLRFHPALDLTGRILACLALASGYVLFALSTVPLVDFRNPRQITEGQQFNSLVTSYESMGITLWTDLAGYWATGPFSFF